jgi:hypothetical protein
MTAAAKMPKCAGYSALDDRSAARIACIRAMAAENVSCTMLDRQSMRIPQLTVSEGQTWSSEDTRVFTSKSLFAPARRLHSLSIHSHRTDGCCPLRGRTHCLCYGRFAPCSMTSRSTAESGFKSETLLTPVPACRARLHRGQSNPVRWYRLALASPRASHCEYDPLSSMPPCASPWLGQPARL